jgi:cyclopropane fatty-acyl-phospholipid synthase-like methyltransferase
MKAGEKHYRAWIGPPKFYDMKSAIQFSLLTTCLGMRENQKLLDIGCGSLRLGRLCLIYLQKGNYFGIEPEEWLVQEGIDAELGKELIEMKDPHIEYNSDFNFDIFNEKFDYMIAQSIFSHTAKWQMELCMKNAANNLSENGRFVFNYGKAKRDYEGNEWVYPGCVRFRPETIHQIVEKFDLHWAEIELPFNFGANWVVVSKNKSCLKICEQFTTKLGPIDPS